MALLEKVASPSLPRSTTATWIHTLAAATILIAVATAFVLASAATDTRDGLDSIGHKAAPQVTATEDLYFALSDLDAQLANVLLAGNDPSLTRVRTEALTGYEQRRTQADTDLQQATTVAGTDATAQQTVRQVLDQLGRYEALAAQTILLNDREGNPAGRPSAGVLALQRQATDLMHDALTTAHRLTDLNSATLGNAYQNKRDATVTARWWLAVLGILVPGTLLGLQILLRVKLRRRINPALALATIVTGALVIGGITLMTEESEYLRGAKQDAFDSLLALRQARAVSYDANADESRYLLDPTRASQYEQAFLDKSQSLAHVPTAGITGYDTALEAAIRAYQTDHTKVPFGGYFGTELDNITFTGERAAAEQTVTTYQAYQRDDRIIRAKAHTDLRDAIAFCTNTTPGNSNYDFTQYDNALTALIDINQHAFDTTITDGENALDGWTGLLPYGAAIVIAALVALGVWPRLAEYR